MNRFQRHFLLFIIVLLLIGQTIHAQTVYVTKTGKKYHTTNCRYLRQSKIETTLAEAIASGYTACSVCDPPTKVSSNTPSPSNSIRKAVSQQCGATTKAGNRCKRMTTNANGQCWQH